MAKHTVVTMPGDGIGEVVLPEAVRVLEAVGFDAAYVPPGSLEQESRGSSTSSRG